VEGAVAGEVEAAVVVNAGGVLAVGVVVVAIANVEVVAVVAAEPKTLYQ
jgi:hypothetical protein